MENRHGFHGRHRINHPSPATGETPTPMSRYVGGIGTERGSGILGAPLNADPHGRGFKMPIGDAPRAARAPNEMGPGLLRANGPLNPSPHPYTPAAQVQEPNTYGLSRVPRR